jgi:hypothetical protein
MNKWMKTGSIGVVAFVAASLATQAAVVYSTSSSAPGANVVEFYEAGLTTKTMSPRNDLVNVDRTVGQTFNVAAAVDVNKLTVRMGNSSTALDTTVGAHVLWLAIMEDTNADGKTDTQVGSTFSYDLAGFNSVGGDYLTFEFDTLSLSSGTYGFELAWREDGTDAWDDASHNLALLRSIDSSFSDGGQISKTDYTGFPNSGVFVSTSNDLTFYVEAIPEPATLGLICLVSGMLVVVRRFKI